MDIVDYLAKEGFIGDDFPRLLQNCAEQGDIEAVQIFLKEQPDFFTVTMKSSSNDSFVA